MTHFLFARRILYYLLQIKRFHWRLYHPYSSFVDYSSLILGAGEGQITIGEHSQVFSRLYLFRGSGNISIGDHCYLGHDTQLWSLQQISLGDRVQISHGCFLCDNRTHPLNHEMRHREFVARLSGQPLKPEDLELNPKPIYIEDDVWICAHSIIHSGVTIGARSIVSAGSCVISDVPSDVIVSGNPARIVKQLT